MYRPCRNAAHCGRLEQFGSVCGYTVSYCLAQCILIQVKCEGNSPTDNNAFDTVTLNNIPNILSQNSTHIAVDFFCDIVAIARRNFNGLCIMRESCHTSVCFPYRTSRDIGFQNTFTEGTLEYTVQWISIFVESQIVIFPYPDTKSSSNNYAECIGVICCCPKEFLSDKEGMNIM